MRFTSDRFDERGRLNIQNAIEIMSVIIEGSAPKPIGHNVIDIGPAVRSRIFMRSKKQVPRSLQQQIWNDINGIEHISILRILK